LLGRAKPAEADQTVGDNLIVTGFCRVRDQLTTGAFFASNGAGSFGGAPMVLKQIAGNNGIVVTDEGGANRKDFFIGLDLSLSHAYIQAVQQGVAFLDTALNPSGGNVGIGTTTPTARLDAETGTGDAILGFSPSGNGVIGLSTSLAGVSGGSVNEFGVFGSNQNTNSAGVSGSGLTGVFGLSSSGTGEGVFGVDNTAGGIGVLGSSQSGTGVFGSTLSGFAGRFNGPVAVTGNLSKGGGSFKIDHPLDPQNKFLEHSFVESPDMKNIYDGVATLDAKGESVVPLPNWFEALNSDFRYQLTSIGQPAATLYVADEIANNRFRIAGGPPGGRVSWQVTGIRKDPYANLHRIPVEEDKPPEQRGTYLHPDAYGNGPAATGDLDQRLRDRARTIQQSASRATQRLASHKH
jgi:hypothetical protein